MKQKKTGRRRLVLVGPTHNPNLLKEYYEKLSTFKQRCKGSRYLQGGAPQ